MSQLSPLLSASSSSPEETICMGRRAATLFQQGKGLILLHGELGAGKTTFIKGLISELCQVEEESIISPTFTYMNLYEGKQRVIHFDLYRLSGLAAFLAQGFTDFLLEEAIVIIEWPDRITSLLPPDYYEIHMDYTGASKRTISISRRIS